jgi:hypothetical protein
MRKGMTVGTAHAVDWQSRILVLLVIMEREGKSYCTLHINKNFIKPDPLSMQ